MRTGSGGISIVLTVMGVLLLGCGGESEVRTAVGSMPIDGAELRWVREGHGPAVFVLGSSVYYPKAFSDRLRQHFELVFMDGRHFVPAYQPDSEALSRISLTTFADDVEALRVELGYDRIHLLGHSIHGQIALEYADRYAASTGKIILIGAVPYAFGEFASAASAIWEELATEERKSLLASRTENLSELLEAAPSSRSFAVGYDRRAPLYWVDPTYDAAVLLEDLENGPAFDRLAATLPSRERARARLERLRAPILLVLGKLDFAIPYTVWEDLIAGLGNVEYVLLETDSHNPQTENADRFDPIMIAWLADS
jgi:proline iminopeptidase